MFAAFGARLHGCIEGVYAGEFGLAWADNVNAPNVAIAHIGWSDLGFSFVAGDTGTTEAVDALRMIPGGSIIVTADAAWDALVRETLGAKAQPAMRTALATPAPDAWDRNRLRAFVAALPGGFAIRRVVAGDLDAFAALEPDLIGNFRTRDAYIERGLGFGVWIGERCVAGCSSYTMARSKIEIEIDTHVEFRRRGLARSVAAAMILHCLDHDIEPCWDAHNPESAALALQLGFIDPQPYGVFRVVRG